MSSFQQIWSEGDSVSRAVTLLLLTMSISAWVLILWKGWVLTRARRDLARAVPAFWAAPDLVTARSQMAALDREQVALPLLDAALQTAPAGTLEAAGQTGSQLTRRLRDALHAVLGQLQFGQVLLASIGATAPFIGLFGTVWGIYHALLGISASGSIGIDKVAGPVGEALIMTAAGLAVAIPAVLAYNLFGKWLGACEADLEGLAHDLREMQLDAFDVANGLSASRARRDA
ncbi:MAG: MotA/TolQ/ExbB proton channel family protein [Leptothrix sp. (in: b-proteobacteria)]